MQMELRMSSQPLPWRDVQAPRERKRVRVISPQAALWFCSFNTATVVVNSKHRPPCLEAARPCREMTA